MWKRLNKNIRKDTSVTFRWLNYVSGFCTQHISTSVWWAKKKVPEWTGGKDSVTWQVNIFVPCFWVLKSNSHTEGSIEAVMSNIPQATVFYLRHLLKITTQWPSRTYTCAYRHAAETHSWLHTVFHTSGGVFWRNKSRQSPRRACQSNLCKHFWQVLVAGVVCRPFDFDWQDALLVRLSSGRRINIFSNNIVWCIFTML